MKSRRVKQVPNCCPSNLVTVWDIKAFILSSSHLTSSHQAAISVPTLWHEYFINSWNHRRVYSNTVSLASRRGGEPPLHTPIPPLPSCSKARATPNVSNVSLAIVHGWATLNGQLVHRPAPYNGPLFPYNLFSAFPSFMKRNFFLSLLPVLSFCSFAPGLGFGI